MRDVRLCSVIYRENTTIGDNPSSFEGQDEEDEIFRDLEYRYTANPISQADFFRPIDLIETHEHTSDIGNAAPKIVVDENLPDDPSVPSIIIHRPDEDNEHADPIGKPPLKKASQLEKKIQFTSEEDVESSLRPKPRVRRHSISVVPEKQQVGKSNIVPSPTEKITQSPPSWTSDDFNPKEGCRMKARCSPNPGGGSAMDIVMVYLYSSALCEGSSDPDADLNLFRQEEKPDIKRSTVEATPEQTIRRAKTDLANAPRQILPLFTKVQDRIEARRSERRPASWLQDQDMLQKQFPGCRIILVGFEISSVLSNQSAFVSAAKQLNEYLQVLRNDQQPPIALLGHSLGGMLILQALVSASPDTNSPNSILSQVAGVFLFSCCITSPDRCARLLNEVSGVRVNEKALGDLFNSPAMKQLSKLAKSKLFIHQPHVRPVSESARHNNQCSRDVRKIAIGFPITQVFGRGDEQGPNGDSLGGFLGTSIRTVTMCRDAAHALRFSTACDVDFVRVTVLLRSKFQTSRLLRAALTKDIKDVETLLRAGTTPNLRDRL